MFKKVTILIAAVAVLCFSAVFAAAGTSPLDAWKAQISGTVSDLNAVYAVDANTAWAAGKNGTIICTVDGGVTWKAQDSGVAQNLHGVFFLDNKNGWAAGEDTTLLKTRDGGATWIKLFAGYRDSDFLTDVRFVNKQKGCISGYFANSYDSTTGFMAYTEDGGANFRVTETLDMQTISTIYFLNDSLGWASGCMGSKVDVAGDDKLFITQNGGKTWNGNYFTPARTFELPKVFSVYMLDELNGWAAGGAYVELGSEVTKVYYTADGAKSWNEMSTGGVEGRIKKIQVFADKGGWAIGNAGDKDPVILYSSDAGKNWAKQVFYKNIVPYGAHFVNSGYGWLVGKNGAVYKYDKE